MNRLAAGGRLPQQQAHVVMEALLVGAVLAHEALQGEVCIDRDVAIRSGEPFGLESECFEPRGNLLAMGVGRQYYTGAAGQ